ncbi:hypothetical protein D4R42_03535 [bacterium]|nr:MAG: hypothetical protein D4R42_03535 [bacterium]
MRKKALIAALGLLVIVLATTQLVAATTVDRAIFCNLQAYPSDTLTENITLYGDAPERTGSWRVFYKQEAGDSEKMDITSWIMVTPAEYTIKNGEAKQFQLTITVPSNATPGLWGATSVDAGIQGHVDQRRTYIEFKDGDAAIAKAGGVVTMTGVRIPVSVNVIAKPAKSSPFTGILEALQSNVITIALLGVVVVLLAIINRLRKKE